MARIRTIKPEFWDDERIAKLPFQARLLFIGTWNYSDDFGIVKANAVWLKSKIFPFDDTLRALDVQKWLNALVEARMLIPLVFENESYYKIRTFRAHQLINRPGKRTIPEAEENRLLSEYNIPKSTDEYQENYSENDHEIITDDSRNIHGGFTERSVNDHGIITERSQPERKGKERKGKDSNKSSCPKNKFSDAQKIFAEDMFSKIKLIAPHLKAKVESWANEIRLIEEQDHIPLNRIKDIFEWAHADSFWKTNILSPASLRRNIPRLEAKMLSDTQRFKEEIYESPPELTDEQRAKALANTPKLTL
ncbi:MAG: hypothetical protein HQM10_26655 [Candidatus Riflebacteria bacterium]|nr:hypothetical protein [Candidatus Riflebacteria bacterium]